MNSNILDISRKYYIQLKNIIYLEIMFKDKQFDTATGIIFFIVILMCSNQF